MKTNRPEKYRRENARLPSSKKWTMKMNAYNNIKREKWERERRESSIYYISRNHTLIHAWNLMVNHKHRYIYTRPRYTYQTIHFQLNSWARWWWWWDAVCVSLSVNVLVRRIYRKNDRIEMLSVSVFFLHSTHSKL